MIVVEMAYLFISVGNSDPSMPPYLVEEKHELNDLPFSKETELIRYLSNNFESDKFYLSTNKGSGNQFETVYHVELDRGRGSPEVSYFLDEFGKPKKNLNKIYVKPDFNSGLQSGLQKRR